MRAKYDPEVDILYIRLSEAPVADSETVEPNLVLDRDADGRVVGVEVLGVSRLQGAVPTAMSFEVAAADAATAAGLSPSGETREARAAE